MADTTSAVLLDESMRVLLSRHRDWWRRSAGLLYQEIPHTWEEMRVPLSDGSMAIEGLSLTPEMLDAERLVGPALEFGPIETIGDMFCTRAPFRRVPWIEAILGCPIWVTIEDGCMRARPFIRDWADWDGQAPGRRDDWFDLLKQLTEMLVARSGGRCAVVQTLMRGPTDLCEAALGSKLMCLSMYDHPQELRRFLEWISEMFIEVLQAQRERIPTIEGGYVNPFGIWAPGTVVCTQCDASAFLSPEQYAYWFLPYDVRICEAADFSAIHLHSGSLHTVDVLLEIERPHAIQVSLDPQPSGPPLESLFGTFRKILASKPLVLSGVLSQEQVQRLQDELPSAGLYISAHQAL